MGLSTEEAVHSPSVLHLTAQLQDRILSGKYVHGRWLPSERELSGQFGVSRMVVQAAVKILEQRGLIARSARCRPIVQYPGNTDVEAPRRTRRHDIGLWIWPNPGDPSGAMIVQGIRKALDSDAYRLIVSSPVEATWQAFQRAERRFLQEMAQDPDIQGVILWYLGAEDNLPMLQRLRDANIPLVFIDRRPPAGFDADYVGVDNERTARQIVEHLIRRNHRVIAHVSNRDTASTVQERRAGYENALRAAGLPVRAELIERDPGPSGEDPNEGTEPLIDRLLAAPEPPTAIFAVSDYVALRVISGLQKRGLRIPQDIAVAGFDGLQRWMLGGPFLTTANQPFESIGVRAVELLLRRIQAGPTAAYQHILLDAPLNINGSTGSPV